ncbi:MAG TPA: right-handed parallel beta-helix repeat-containing protein [Ilumatobacteraceae bacterium]|nr:right-handed parallel beta-helix repeat-containing protein [Ilumatobacteraceae bacterium]
MRTLPSFTTTRTLRLLAAPLVVAAGVAVAPAVTTADGETPITCGTVVTADVRLRADLVDCAGAGLVIGAPGITVDLAGHVIDGTGSATGIDNSAGHDDIRITRGTVRDFQFGIHLFETSGARVDRLTVESNIIGAIIERSTATELDRVTATSSDGMGIEITFSEGITVRRSTVAANGLYGIFDIASIGSRYERNTITGNAGSGLALWQSDQVVVERNHAAGNDTHGIDLTGVASAVVERNEAIANGEHGIFIDQPGTTVVRNRAIANQGIGIAAPAGTIDGGRNTATGNLGGDCTSVACR